MSPLIAHLDESDLGDDVTVVGGVVSSLLDVPDLVADWLKLRETFGHPEVKYGALRPDEREAVLQFIVDNEMRVLTDVLIDERRFRPGVARPPRDHYRWGLAWCAHRVALLARETDDTGPHLVVADTVPTAASVGKTLKGDVRLAAIAGNRNTYASIMYAEAWNVGSAGYAPLRQQDLYPGLLESDATHNPLLELADVAMGVVGRWAKKEIEGTPDRLLEGLVRLVAPTMVFPPPKEFGMFSLFCGGGYRCTTHAGIKNRLERYVISWGRGQIPWGWTPPT